MMSSVVLRLVSQGCTRPVLMLSHTEMHLKHLVSLTQPATLSSAHKDKRKHHWGCPPLHCSKMLSYKHTLTHTQSDLRIPWSVALYLQTMMPQGHKADHYSFETGSPTRPLNVWLLTYIPFVLNIGHKTSCLYLFIWFLPSHLTVNHKNLNNPSHTRNNILEQREKKHNWVSRATGQQFDSSTYHTLILWGLPCRLFKHLLCVEKWHIKAYCPRLRDVYQNTLTTSIEKADVSGKNAHKCKINTWTQVQRSWGQNTLIYLFPLHIFFITSFYSHTWTPLHIRLPLCTITLTQYVLSVTFLVLD